MIRIAIRSLCFMTAFWCLLLCVISLVGCGPVYKAIGLPPAIVVEQTNKDANSIVATVEQARETFWPIINASIAGIATIISGYLGVTLRKEKKITSTLITGVELANNGETKDAIFLASNIANNAKAIDARVQTLTSGNALPEIAVKKTEG